MYTMKSIIEGRLEPISKHIVGEYLGGLQYGKSTADLIFLVKQILKRCWEYKVDFHSNDRSVLYKILFEIEMPANLIRFIRITMSQFSRQVKI